MAGRTARILVTSTRDLGQVFRCMHDVKYDGHADIVAAIQKAQLALKHRQNAMQKQRIVVFVLSPITAPKEKLVRLGKLLKKNQVAVDVLNVGDEGDNTEKIDAFISAVEADGNCQALHIPSGGPRLADAMMNSNICVDRDAAGAGGGGSAAMLGGRDIDGDADFPFGVDPAQDPELAMVLRMSMEEERARQEAAARERNNAQAQNEEGSRLPRHMQPSADPEYDDDDDLYGTSGDGKDNMDVEGSPKDTDAAQAGSSSAGASGASDANDDDDEEMDEETRRAIELSKTDFEAPKEDEGGKQ